MPAPHYAQPTTDAERTRHKMELLIGLLLRGGVLISAAVVMIGGILYLWHHGAEPPNVHVFAGEPASFRSMPGILHSAAALEGRGIIALGLLLLVATPLARVAFTLVTFLHQRDWVFVLITAIVLGALLSTLGPLL